MKIKTLATFIFPVLMFLISCQKEFDFFEETIKPSTGQLIRMQQGTGKEDTVHLIIYDSAMRIKLIIDSTHHDTLEASYDLSGNLVGIIAKYPNPYSDRVSAVYDENGLLLEYDYIAAGTHEKLVFEYKDKIVAKQTVYSNAGSGSELQIRKYFLYEVSNGNITNIKQYSVSNVLQNEKKLSYGTEPNPFKKIALFNFSNILGTEHIINIETFFCANVLTGLTTKDGYTVTSSYTYDNEQKLVKIVTRENEHTRPDDYLFTWQFFYK